MKISKPDTISNENLTESMRRNTIATIPPTKPPRNEQKPPQDEWESKLFGKQSKCKLIIIQFSFSLN